MPNGGLELVNIISFLAEKFPGAGWARDLYLWQNVFFALFAGGIIVFISFLATRKIKTPPGRLQCFMESLVEQIDNFVQGILGPKGRKFTSFIGTLFVYILLMNLFSLIPFMKSATANLSTTFALALCVFVYVHYSAIRENGIRGYIDHLMGRPRGALAFSVILPLFMFFIHLVSELIKPVSLSLRLRSNMWADDTLLAALLGFGLKGVPLVLFCTVLAVISAIVQAVVFSLLSTIYFALFLQHEE